MNIKILNPFLESCGLGSGTDTIVRYRKQSLKRESLTRQQDRKKKTVRREIDLQVGLGYLHVVEIP